MDLRKEMVNAETVPADTLNFDDFIPPFYIKNKCKGTLIDIKTEVNALPYPEQGYLYNLLNVKCEPKENLEDTGGLPGKAHRVEKPHKCDQCFYSFKSKYNLVLHKKTHLHSKQYSCHLCGYRAILPTTIKKHMIVHGSSDKQYKCTVCNFQTMYKHSLQFHMKRHTGEKPFECSLCDYRTIQKANLAFHMRRHTGDEYFKCALCRYRTANKEYLVAHQMKHREENAIVQQMSHDEENSTDIKENLIDLKQELKQEH